MLKSWNQHSSRSQHAPIWRHRGCIVVPSRVDIWLKNATYLIFFFFFFFFFVGNKKHKCVGSSPSLHLDGWVVRVDIRGCQEVRREDAAGNQQTHQRGSGTSSYSSYSPTLAFWGYFTDVERNLEINWKVSELCEQLLVNLFQFSFPYDSGWQFELVQ